MVYVELGRDGRDEIGENDLQDVGEGGLVFDGGVNRLSIGFSIVVRVRGSVGFGFCLHAVACNLDVEVFDSQVLEQVEQIVRVVEIIVD